MQTNQVSREWIINKKKTSVPTLSTNSYKYTGTTVTPSWESFSSTEVSVGGTTSASTPGEYTTTFTPKPNYCWPDETTTVKSITWTIEGEIVSLPTQAGILTYTGSTQSPVWNGYDSSKLTIGGTTSGTNAGDYTATFTPKSGCVWSDGTITAKNVTWTIGRATTSAIPSVSGTLTYNGSSQSPTWNNYDSSKLTIGGTTSGVNVGNYTTTFTPNSNWCWANGTTEAKSVTWSIGRLTLTVPTQSGKLTYSGSSQSPTWDNYNATFMTQGGTTSATDAGSYTTTFTLKSTTNTQWSGKTLTDKNVTWTISKATGTLTLDPSSLSFDKIGTANSKTIAAITNNTGAVNASSNSSVVTTVVNRKNITVTPKANGTATITVGVVGDNNYTTVNGVKCSVTVSAVKPSIQSTADEFYTVVTEGRGPSSYSVGDLLTIPVSGTLGSYTWSGSYYPCILGFGHNGTVEDVSTYSADIQFAMSSDGQKAYAFETASKGFQMNSTTTNVGGYKASELNKVLDSSAAFRSLIGSAWRSKVAVVRKYQDITGAGNVSQSGIGPRFYYTFILSEFEVFGVRKKAHPYEQTKQKQYDYYANGASLIRNRINTSTPVYCWLASPSDSNDKKSDFCMITPDGVEDSYYAKGDLAIAPCCRIGVDSYSWLVGPN